MLETLREEEAEREIARDILRSRVMDVQIDFTVMEKRSPRYSCTCQHGTGGVVMYISRSLPMQRLILNRGGGSRREANISETPAVELIFAETFHRSQREDESVALNPPLSESNF